MKRSFRLMLFLFLLGFLPVSALSQNGSCGHENYSDNYYVLVCTGGSSSFNNEGPNNLFDSNSATKWCADYPLANNAETYVTFNFGGPVYISSYTLRTADDIAAYQNRNWKSWVLYGKNIGSDSWTVVHTVTDAQLPTTNSTVSSPFNVNTQNAAYQYYKLVLTAVVGGSTENIHQMADVNFVLACPGGHIHGTVDNPHVYDNGYCKFCRKFMYLTEDDDGYYIISNKDELEKFVKLVNGTIEEGIAANTSANAKLTADIVVNQDVLNENGEPNNSSFTPWIPIGNSENKYSGTFDGAGHTISGLYFNDNNNQLNSSYVGLFGYISGNAVVKNVGVIDSYINAEGYVGGVVGYNEGATVSNCFNSGSVKSDTSEQTYIGGVVGYCTEVGNFISPKFAEVSECYNIGNVIVNRSALPVSGKTANIGGVVGCAGEDGSSLLGNNIIEITNCYNSGSVTASGIVEQCNIGGIVGNNNNGNISLCYNAGTVICTDAVNENYLHNIGGIVGCNKRYISNSYNCGTVKAEAVTPEGNNYSITIIPNIGGIAGLNIGGYSNGYYTGNCDGRITSCCNTGLVTSENYEYEDLNNNSFEAAIVGVVENDFNISNCYFITGSADIAYHDADNAIQNRIYEKSLDDFKSGEVAYLLQGTQTTQVWGQNIDNGQTRQDYPVFSDARVYEVTEGSLYTNKIGGNVLWSYEDNTLTIHGSGNMRDFGATETKPWSNYLSEINTVVVKAGITGIGSYAFSDVNAGKDVILYCNNVPITPTTVDENGNQVAVAWIKSTCNLYVPNLDIWNNFTAHDIETINKMPTYTGAWSTHPGENSHVVINSALVLGQQSTDNRQQTDAVLNVQSVGFIGNGSLTIKDGGQLICQQAHGEVTVEKEIQSYSQEPTAKSQSSTKWYTISSPLKGNVAATSTSITGLIPDDADTYALYRYDEPSFTWQNYKYQDNNFNTLDAGRGYLYARSSSEVTTLQFTGDINTAAVNYKLTANGSTLSGIHLVGNPFTRNITFGNLSVPTGVTLAEGYYVLSNQGGWATTPSTDGDIKPGQGILIKTTTAGTLTISPNATTAKGEQPTANSQEPMLALNVSNGNYSDRAFVIFGKGIGLDKINHQNEDIPVLYIPMSDADYAIAMMDENVNEIPVGFESSSMGEFTISLRQENCEFEELYLLDKETGAKVNILEQDYTFMATSGDNPDRFILVKSQGSQPEAQSNFAYINNGDVVIYGAEGNAQIDIYDVLGRHVYNANGSDDVHILTTDGYSAGVYVIRLMDEKGLRTQKVVIE